MTQSAEKSTEIYAQKENDATRVFISLLTVLAIFVDDLYQNDSKSVRVFLDRFARGKKQEEPLMDAFALALQEIPDHFEPVVGNLILTAILNVVTASILEFQTQGMQISQHAEGYPNLVRQLSGGSKAYALMLFPRHIPLQTYIQVSIAKVRNAISKDIDV